MGEDIFGYGGGDNGDANPDVNGQGNDVTDLNKGGKDTSKNGEDVTDLSKQNPDDNKDGDNKPKGDGEENDNDDDKGGEEQELTAGTKIEAEGKTYTVDDKGNLLDENGNIFKEKKDVQEWLKSFDNISEGSEGDLTVADLQKQIGIEIKDDNGNPVQFENSLEGFANYFKAVIDQSREEHYQTAINTLYEKYPILEDVINYYVANGNSLQGFNEMPDRTNIEVDEKNEEQQAAIIRVAWAEKGNKGDVEGYIQYLKTSGTLLSTAKDELQEMKEADAEAKRQMAEEAKQQEEEAQRKQQEYWEGVKDTVLSRNIAGYSIPESIVINRNGQKMTATPMDFFNYLYQIDGKGHSRYEYDLAKIKPEDRRNDEILRAYLTFTGGSYSNLIDMAINQKEIMKLRKKASEQRNSSVRIIKPDKEKTTKKGVDIDLGY